MKAFLILSIVLLISCFQASAVEDVDQRFVDFLDQSLAKFPKWLDEHGYVNGRIRDHGGRFHLETERENEEIVYSIRGELKNRFYVGADKNIRSLGMNASVSDLTFYVDIGVGDGVTDTIQGKYSIRGYIGKRYSFNWDGNFTRTDLLTSPTHNPITCQVGVTEDGYFSLHYCMEPVQPAKFANLTLEGVEPGYDPDTHLDNDKIIGMANAWYDAQLRDHDSPDTMSYWFDYIIQLFQATPIVDIIGITLPPTLQTSIDKISGRSATFQRKRQFDSEKRKMVQMNYISY